MRIELPYGDGAVAAELPDICDVRIVDIEDVAPIADVDAATTEALAESIGMRGHFLDGYRGGETVCIVVSDSFRRTEIHRVLPALLAALNDRGIADESIRFLFATGVHRAPTPDEQRAILGAAIAERFRGRLFVHDAYDEAEMVALGTTRRGTGVAVNRVALESDRVIATGSIVFHYFGGFGGGRKAIVPGVASVKTIAHNHALNLHPTEDRLDPSVRIGALEGNPVAEDMLEAARMVDIDGIVNTVLNRRGEIAGLFAGEMEAAHEAGCAMARDVFAAEIDEPADVVIAASAGTKNFVQTHKALYNAASACKADGRIVLAAPCPEGLGGATFTKWLDLGNPASVIRELRQNSEINGQTALSTLEKAPRTRFVTEMTEDDVGRLGGRKCATLQDAVDGVCAERPRARVIVMPNAAYCVPVLGAALHV